MQTNTYLARQGKSETARITELLLTSGDIKNNSIRNALVDMLGKPIEGSTALFIPTAAHPLEPFLVWRATQDFTELPWKEFGVLELTALPSIRREDWLPKREATDALLVGGERRESAQG